LAASQTRLISALADQVGGVALEQAAVGVRDQILSDAPQAFLVLDHLSRIYWSWCRGGPIHLRARIPHCAGTRRPR
jgi:hypothetical protein